MSILQIDYRGYNFLPRNAKSQFNVEYFFAGMRGPRFEKSFRGPMDDDYLVRNALGVEAIVWSACGDDVILRANSSIRVTSTGGEAFSTVDSTDVSAAIVYRLQWRRCG
jgi:hypothetical protein